MSVYYSIVHFYLQYAIICRSKTIKTVKLKLQDKQNHIKLHVINLGVVHRAGFRPGSGITFKKTSSLFRGRYDAYK